MQMFLDHEKKVKTLEAQNKELTEQLETLHNENLDNEKLFMMEIEQLKAEAKEKIDSLRSEIDIMNEENDNQCDLIIELERKCKIFENQIEMMLDSKEKAPLMEIEIIESEEGDQGIMENAMTPMKLFDEDQETNNN